MSTLTIRQANTSDFDAILGLLEESVQWLRGKGLDQWSTWETWRTKMRPSLERGDVWLLCDRGEIIGTVTVETAGDSDFWSREELNDPAAYVSKLAVRRDRAGENLGQLLLDWAGDHAYRYGCDYLRLDAWKSNERLHAYYLAHGWKYIRTAEVPGRKSGALFQIGALPLTRPKIALLDEVPEIPAIEAPMRLPAESADPAGNVQPGHTHQCEQVIVVQKWLSAGPMRVIPGLRYRFCFRDGQWQFDTGRHGEPWTTTGDVVKSAWLTDPRVTYILTHDERRPCSVRLAEFTPGGPLAVLPYPR